jgi:hypothetical protein
MNIRKQKNKTRTHRRRWSRRAPRRARRGVLLLVVLSMLIVFLMTAVTYVVVSRHFHEASKATSQVERLVEPAQELLDAAMYDLLRDTMNPASRVRYHSLLRDMYGDDGFVVDNVEGDQLVAAALVLGTDGQFMDLRIKFDPQTLPLSEIDNYYNGHVLTMADGPAAGLSTRIVGYERLDTPAGIQATIRVLSFERGSHDAARLVPQPGDRFLVNGRPFNGTGIGYDGFASNNNGIGYYGTGSGHVDLKNNSTENLELALIPNLMFSDPGNNPKWFAHGPGQGGTDEGYDVADYQNMLLALMPMNPTIPTSPAGMPLKPEEVDRIVQPSLHSRALINYWIKGRLKLADESTWNPLPAQVLGSPLPPLAAALDARRVVMRPLVADHPKFPRLASLINGPWDVDNDGDGVPDSIWVDLGYPPVKMRDGRFYKPMFAILVQDLDGRLNLNAHGSREEIVDGRRRPTTEDDVILASADSASPRTAMSRPAGQGVGPAEISLWPLVTVGSTPRPEDYTRLVNGGDVHGIRNQLPGRYGADKWPGAPATQWDLLAQMKFWEYPVAYRPPAYFTGGIYSGWASPGDAFLALARRGYSTPPDLKGRFGLGVGFHGFPNFKWFHEDADMSATGQSMVAESPYEKNLLQDGPRSDLSTRSSDGQMLYGEDALFTVAELERLLRAHDADVGHLPDRLLRMGSVFNGDIAPGLPPGEMGTNIRSVTVRSIDLPVPSVAAPYELQQDLRSDTSGMQVAGGPPNTTDVQLLGARPSNVVDLLLARLRQGGMNVSGMSGNQKRLVVRQLLSPDVLDNLKMNLNRPFGDARDNDGDGAVDDPDEARRGLDAMWGPLRGANAVTAAAAGPTDANRVYPAQRLDIARMKDADMAALDPAEDKSVTSPEERVFAAANARQFMARDLFVLMMLLKHPDYEFTFVEPAIEGDQQRKDRMTALRLAQWAVNAVDFRDADSIMTGFEADVDPFTDNDSDPTNGTWDVDGDLSTVEAGRTQYRHVVWGMERPDLLITETLATHDLRVRDSSRDSSGRERDEGDDGQYDSDEDDNDLDQFRIPQGSLFVELLCTGNPTNAVMPGELYEFRDELGKWVLALGKTPPGGDPNPVWRLAISAPHTEEGSVRNEFLQHPESTTFQPTQFSLLEANSDFDIDRYVWFTQVPPSGARVADADRIFWNTGVGQAPAVPAGHYAVVGPDRRPSQGRTYFGSQLDDTGDRSPAAQFVRLATGQILTNATGSTFSPAFDTTSNGNGNVKAAYGISAGMRVERGRAGFSWTRPATIGLNISEPVPDATHPYYPEPTVQLNGYPEEDAYGDDAGADQLLDEPLDLDGDANRPIAQLGTVAIGTHENIRTIFLQRLADPTMPWNPPPGDPSGLHDSDLPVNPYITVDWKPVDLSVFNGEDRKPANWAADDGNYVSEGYTGDVQNIRFSTRERGLKQGPPLQAPFADNIWRAESNAELRDSSQTGSAQSFFRHALKHSLGYLNETYGRPIVIPDGSMSPENKALALGAPADPNAPQAARPFPWLTWNDRPYVSQLELLQVPISAPGRLTVEHSVAADDNFQPYSAQSGVDDAYKTPGAIPATQQRFTNINATFGHLLNFFATTQSSPGPDFYRLLEYTGVPSPFVGTELFLNPVVFRNLVGDTELRRPPFNRISMYRDPGQVNLNAIFSEKVYWGLFHGDPEGGGTTVHPGPAWEEFVENRRGYTPSNPGLDDKMFALNEASPTFFAGFYGPPDAGRHVPLTGDPDGEPEMGRTGIEMGLLRPDRVDSPNQPLFRDHESNVPATDEDKHPYFRYQAIQRLENLTTTRSNEYAVWITVGFFEMEPVPASHRQALVDLNPAGPQVGQELFDRLYPEGMWLTTEMGSDTGQVQRYRGFYIIDRSIPVAFEPGRNHNVDRAILLRRRIE